MQLVLPLKTTIPKYHHADFIVSASNTHAFEAIQHWETWANKTLILYGEECSGKTHLSNIWSKAAKAVKIDHHSNISALTRDNILLEDAHLIANTNWLLHLINFAREFGLAMMITTSTNIMRGSEDLQSRLRTFSYAAIKSIDDELLQVIISRHFSNKQIQVDSNILAYLENRLPRNYNIIRKFVNALDEFAIRTNKKITIPTIRNFLETKWLKS